ncbi:Beta-glucuronidase [Colletotrichum tropicale]|nr:Beta-glucuronidase [Colletotrichum tropicale]
MLRPQANATRDIISLDGIWNFALAQSGDIEVEQAWKTLVSPDLQVPVPASYNDIFADDRIRDHVGWVYYQRQVTIPRGWSQDRYFLRVDAATHRGRVYVDDEFVTEHIGGYTPFEAELTTLVNAGSKLRLTIAVCNELDWDTIPPGRIEVLADGTRKQSYQHDFFNYAGLARSVWIYSVPTTFIDNITTSTTLLNNGGGTVDFDIGTSQALVDQKCKVSLFDEEENIVSQAYGHHGQLVVDSVTPWEPGKAYLYQLQAEILSSANSEGKVIDTYRVPIGIRSIEVKGNRFLINGKPFYFTGFGKHEDAPVRGRGHDAAYMVHDYRLMKWMGANSFRTSHYPYAEEVLDYADRHGVVVINETAAVGLNLNIVSGIFGDKRLATFSPETMSEKTQAAHAQGIRELIARDKNHPSVVMWTLANEPAASEEGAREYFEPLVTLARSLDSTRPICYAHMIHSKPETDLIADLFDVICMNRYYGWYTQIGNLKAAEVALETELRGWQAKWNKPIIMTEYGTDTVVGLHAVCDVPWSEEYQTRFLEMFHRVFDRIDNVVGEHVWNFADFQTTSMIIRVDGNKKGVFTRDRRPKSSVHSLRARWTALVGQKKLLSDTAGKQNCGIDT